MEITRAPDKINKTPQEMQNLGFDTEFNIPVVELLGYDPVNDVLRRVRSDETGNIVTSERPYSVRIAYSGTLPVYVGEAAPGSLTSETKWKIKKLTYSGDNVSSVLWADGDTNFDNIWDNRATLSYS